MTNLPRFSLTMEDDLLDKVEKYQEENGFSTRNKAILDLITAGIADMKKNDVPRQISSLQQELLDAVDGLSDDDIRVLIGLARRMSKE